MSLHCLHVTLHLVVHLCIFLCRLCRPSLQSLGQGTGKCYCVTKAEMPRCGQKEQVTHISTYTTCIYFSSHISTCTSYMYILSSHFLHVYNQKVYIKISLYTARSSGQDFLRSFNILVETNSQDLVGSLEVLTQDLGGNSKIRLPRSSDITQDLRAKILREKRSKIFGSVSFKIFRDISSREGDHIRLVLTKKDSKGVSSKLVKQVSANLRKIGCRCVIDEQVRKTCKSRVMSVPVHCVNRFECLAIDTCSDDDVEDVPVVDSVALKTKVLASKMRKQLRLATWNVSCLCSERKQKEIADLLACNSIDIVAVQESWEKEDSKMDISGLVSLVLVKGVREGREGLGS